MFKKEVDWHKEKIEFYKMQMEGDKRDLSDKLEQ